MSMPAAEYRVALDRLGRDISSAGRMPGATKADAKRWAKVVLAVPDDVARMMPYRVRFGTTPVEIRDALHEG